MCSHCAKYEHIAPVLPQLITLKCTQLFCHFTQKETEAHILSDLPKATYWQVARQGKEREFELVHSWVQNDSLISGELCMKTQSPKSSHF